MPKEQATPLSRGPGSVSPDFTAPSVPVATPGRQLEAAPTGAEAFRDAILTFGQGVASAVSARATINNRIKALKEQSMAEVEQDLNRSARSFQRRRLEAADRQRQNLLVEAGEKGQEWAEREFRSRMTNAASGEEARLWEQAWTGAAKAAQRDNAEAQRQSFNQAKMSMQEVGLALSEELQESVPLQQTLTGDGQNIHARVQDWMLTRVQRQVDMDKLSEEDAQFLVHQTIVQAARIGDQLRGQHAKAVEDSNERLGARQFDADLFSTMTGEQDPIHVRQQIEVTLRDRFSHLTLEQQDDMVRETIAASLGKLANGEFGIENFGALDAATELINLTVNGRKVYDAPERARLEAQLFTRAEGTLRREFEGRLSVAREQFTKTVTLPDGTQVTRIDIDADAKLLTPDPDTGVSQLDRITSSLVEEIDPDSSLGSARLVGVIRDIERQMHQGVHRAANKTAADWATTVNVLSGGQTENPASDGNLAHQLSPETKVTRTPRELAANGRAALSTQEERHLRDSYKAAAVGTGMDPALVDAWSGETIGTDHPLRPLADVVQANLWNHPDVVRNTGIPPALARDKVALLTSDNPADLKSFATFITTLDGGAAGAYQSFLASPELGDSERAAAMHVRTTMMRGRADFNKDGNPVIQNPGDESTDMNLLHSQAQQLLGVPSRRGWLWNRPDGRDSPSNAEKIATFWAEAMRADDDPRMYSEADWDANLDEMVLGMVRALDQDTALGDWVGRMHQSQSALDSTLDEGQIASVLKAWMDRDGLRLKQAGASRVLVLRDPANHTGPAGNNLDQHAAEKLTTPFPPWARAVIMDALGAKPSDAPENIQGLYLFGRQGVVSGNQILPDAKRALTLEDMRVEGLLIAEYGNTPGDNQRRLDSRRVMGGAVLHATTVDGEGLHLPTAIRRIEFTYPDGTPGVIEEGQIISIVNSDFTPSPAPTPRTRTGGYVSVGGSLNPGFRPKVVTLPGANIPEE